RGRSGLLPLGRGDGRKARLRGLALVALPLVLDARVKGVLECLDESARNLSQISDGEPRLIELPELHLTEDDPLDQALDLALIRGLLERARRRLDGIANGEDGGFARLRRYARIAEIALGELLRVAGLLVLDPEKLEQPVAVM